MTGEHDFERYNKKMNGKLIDAKTGHEVEFVDWPIGAFASNGMPYITFKIGGPRERSNEVTGELARVINEYFRGGNAKKVEFRVRPYVELVDNGDNLVASTRLAIVDRY